MPNDPLDEIEHQRAAYLDALMKSFTSDLNHLILKVNSKVAVYLHRKLTVTNGVIDSSASNLRVLRTLNVSIEGFMDDEGLRPLLVAFVGQFPEQYKFIYDELKLLDVILPGSLPSVKFKSDTFSSFQLNAVSAIETTMESAADSAMNRGQLILGGMDFGDLVEHASEALAKSVPKVESLAETSASIFFRTAQARAYEVLQRSFPDLAQTFKYFGPLDIKTRPLCQKLLAATEPFTRKQIDEIKPVWFPIGTCWEVCGGPLCRHRWRLYYDQKAIKAAA